MFLKSKEEWSEKDWLKEFFDMKCLFRLNPKCEFNSQGLILVFSKKELRLPI